jgi:hypothetical protein
MEIGSRFVFAALDKGGTPYARVISFGAFELDHIGPQICQSLADPRPCEDAGQFDYFQALQSYVYFNPVFLQCFEIHPCFCREHPTALIRSETAEIWRAVCFSLTEAYPFIYSLAYKRNGLCNDLCRDRRMYQLQISRLHRPLRLRAEMPGGCDQAEYHSKRRQIDRAEKWPNINEQGAPLPDADQWADKPYKLAFLSEALAA